MLLEAKISTKRGTWSQALIPQPGELMSHSVGSDNNHINTRLCEYYRIEIENLATPLCQTPQTTCCFSDFPSILVSW